MAEKQGLSGTAKLVLGVVALGAMCVPCIGVSAAIGLPAFTNYTRRALVAEARANLGSLRSAVELSGAPPTLPPTPELSSLGPEPRAWPISADPGWARIGFTPVDPVRYSYSVRPDPSMGTVTLEAAGDLDGDGFQSHFTQTGRIDPATGGIVWGELVVLDELE